jgi:gliding motility-associated-like protein
VVSVVQEARIFLPKAFIPTSEIPENRIWKPGNLYAQDQSYSLIIMDRWGKTLFKTNNPEEGWDGKTDQGFAPQGVYVFVLKYKSFDGLVREEKGFITLLN